METINPMQHQNKNLIYAWIVFLASIFQAEGVVAKDQIAHYSIALERDGSSLVIAHQMKSGDIIFGLRALGGYRWFDAVFGGAEAPNLFLLPSPNQNAEMSDYIRERYNLGDVTYEYMKQDADQLLFFKSREAETLIKGFFARNEGFALSGLANDSWYAGNFSPITTIKDVRQWAQKFPNSLCRSMDNQIIKNLGVLELSNESLTNAANSVGIFCDQFYNVRSEAKKDQQSRTTGPSSAESEKERIEKFFEQLR